MIIHRAAPIDPKIREAVRSAAANGVSSAELIQWMRDAGLAKIPSIRLLSEHLSIPLAEAKRLVHLSPVWQDCFQTDERLHEVVEAALEADLAEQRLAPDHAA